MLARLLFLAALAAASSASADDRPLFAPLARPEPKIFRLLAPPATLDLDALQQFETASGYQIAYDAYEGALDLAEKWREGPYDLVVLSGTALAREIAAGALVKLDHARLGWARNIQPAVLAKIASYDPGNLYGVPLGWYATGLLYDVDKARERLGGAPDSWNALFSPNDARKMADCGVVFPDDRDTLFAAAWRLLAIDPEHVNLQQVKAGSTLIGRSRPTARAFATADVVSPLASGAACLSIGDAGEAAAASARSREGGAGADIRFAVPKEGGGLVIVAFAIPRDAAHLDQAYELLDFLLQPNISVLNAIAARLTDAQAGEDVEILKRLSPQGVYSDPHVAPQVQAEWDRLITGK